jgi:hypothetical protein
MRQAESMCDPPRKSVRLGTRIRDRITRRYSGYRGREIVRVASPYRTRRCLRICGVRLGLQCSAATSESSSGASRYQTVFLSFQCSVFS